MITRSRQLLFLWLCFGILSASTGQTTDSPDLSVVQVFPNQDEKSAAINTSVIVTFDKQLDPASLDSTTFVVFGERSGRIRGSISYSTSTKQATFQAFKDFSAGERVTAILSSAIRSVSGSSLTMGYIWNFEIQSPRGSYDLEQSRLDLGMPLSSIIAFDFNHDNQSEIAVTGTREGKHFLQIRAVSGSVSTLISEIEIPFSVRPLVVGDLNRDGVPDLVLLHRNNASFSVCFLDSQGKLRLGKTYPVGIGLDGDQFATQDASSVRLNPGESKTIQVSFNPQNSGEKTTHLLINSNDPRYPVYQLPLAGKSPEGNVITVPDIEPSTTVVNFGPVLIGETRQIILLINNVGGQALDISSVRIGGTDADQFSQLIPVSQVIIPATKSQKILLDFFPKSSGYKNAYLEILSNDPNEPRLYILLRGHGSLAPSSGSVTQLPLFLTSSHSQAVNGEDWSNAIDSDTEGWDGTVTDQSTDSFAVFGFSDNHFKTLTKIRVMTDTKVGYSGRWVNLFRVDISLTGLNNSDFTELFTGRLQGGNWQEFNVPNIPAKYVRLVLLKSVNPTQPYKQLGEFEIYGIDIPPASGPELLVDHEMVGFTSTNSEQPANRSVTISNTGGSPLEIASFELETYTEPRSAAITDLNNDGFLDVVILNRLRNAQDFKTVLLYLNDKTGALGVNGIENDWFWSNRRAEAIVARDFNGDGLVDLAATHQGDSRTGGISIFTNPGGGLNFSDTPQLALSVSSDFESSAAADFTGDHLPDLATTDLNTELVYLFTNNRNAVGQLSFAAPRTFPTFKNPFWLNFGDMNADTHHDLATIHNRQETMTTLQNDGNGQLSQRALLNITPKPVSFSVGDFNADAALDFFVVDSSGIGTLLLNRVTPNNLPAAPLLLSPPNNTYSKENLLVLTWQVPLDSDNDPLHFVVTIYRVGIVEEIYKIYDSRKNPELFLPTPPISQDVKSVSLQADLPEEGSYKWKVSASDGIGMGPASEIWGFVIDRTSPADLSISLGGSVKNGHWYASVGLTIPVLLGYTEQNADSAVLETPGLGGPYRQSPIPSGTNVSTTFNVNVASTSYGRYSTNGRIIDRALNSNATRSWVGFDPIVPIIHSITFAQSSQGYFDASANRYWFNQDRTPTLSTILTYTEDFPKSIIFDPKGIAPPVTRTTVPAGPNVQVSFDVSIQSAADGRYTFTNTVKDSAENTVVKDILLGLDKTPPTGTVASAPEVSATLTFPVQWSAGTDGSGSGMSGRYDVYLKMDDGEWVKWLTDHQGLSASYAGQHLHSYAFEALGKDRIGNIELRIGSIGETTVFVDTTADDIDAPPAPINLHAGGASPSPWQKEPVFQITWTNPPDESGIASSFYKLGSPPTSNSDYTGTGPAMAPFEVTSTQEGKQRLYLWLADKRGNTDYRNHASVLLRWDKTLPVILAIGVQNPMPNYTSGTKYWYNGNTVPKFETKVNYTEKYARSAILNTGGLNGVMTQSPISSGENVSVIFNVSTQTAVDSLYQVTASIQDSTNNNQGKTIQIGVDRTAPASCIATSPQVAAQTRFNVLWSTGSDGKGSGVASYDVYVAVNNGAWSKWIEKTTRKDSIYVGQHGSIYSFEAVARDYVGNEEARLGVGESTTKVDTLANDNEPPLAPINLSAGGQIGASPWQDGVNFEIDWKNPLDKSGIAASFYKIGTRPKANFDTTGMGGKGPAEGPFNVEMTDEGKAWLHLWLMDNRGNINHQNTDSVLLRLDLRAPQIQSLVYIDVAPHFKDLENRGWFSQKKQSQIFLQLEYTESQADSILLYLDNKTLLYSNPNPQSGTAIRQKMPVTIRDMIDGRYSLDVVVVDVAGKKSRRSLALGLDSTAPAGTLASSPDTSATLGFTVTWQPGTDQGSGLSGYYRVFSQENEGPWQVWQDSVLSTSAVFQGKDKTTFGFQALAWDRMGLLEVLQSAPESVTRVDSWANDDTAPSAPINLLADNKSPSPWKKSPQFRLNWTQPPDQSGIAKSFFKFSSPPQNNSDYNGFGGSDNTLDVRAPQEGAFYVYVWLQDNRGNVDYRNHARVQLRYDKTPPVIVKAQFDNPAFGRYWFDPQKNGQVNLSVNYQEYFADSLNVRFLTGPQPILNSNPSSGFDAQAKIPIKINDLADGKYAFRLTIVDSAGNRTSKLDTLGVDALRPFNTKAFSPDTSASTNILVSWSAGEDGAGAGVSGFYDVYVREDNKKWEIWKEKFKGRGDSYTKARHKHTYSFEVLAYDHLGHLEDRTQTAESKTFVDTTLSDLNPPAAPINLTAGGTAPKSPWQKSAAFVVSWQNPSDPSGIAKSLYQIGAPPSSPVDTFHTASGTPPLTITSEKEGEVPLYLWLMDGRGNQDHTRHASVILRRDKTAPRIDSLRFQATDFGKNWFNPNLTQKANLEVFYSESHLHKVEYSPATWLNPPTSTPGRWTFPVSFPELGDNLIMLKIMLQDSAGNVSQDSTLLGLDASPPQGTLASSPAVAGPGNFLVSWAGTGTDGNGSGLKGEYDIKVRTDDGPWTLWEPARFRGTSRNYPGEEGHSYAFEVAAWDNVGNREIFTETVESATTVSASFFDVTAPDAPIGVTANGASPSPWLAATTVRINWTNPVDPSGIVRCYYKLGAPPEWAADTTGSFSATPPATLAGVTEGKKELYLWLVDGRGNVDHQKRAQVTLRNDRTKPIIHAGYIANAQYAQKFINPDSASEARIRIEYSETSPDTLHILTGPIRGELIRTGLKSGINQFVEIPLAIQLLVDGCFPITAVLSDSAGNRTSLDFSLCLDRTPPSGAKATSPDTSFTPAFTVSWANLGVGSDGPGSGLSGEYGLRIKIDEGPWFDVFKRERRLNYNYVGLVGHKYSFEVAAWDQVGNRELFTGIPETSTLIDTAFVDIFAPVAPEYIMIAGSESNLWRNDPKFELTWQNPVDPSGITKVYYKLDTPPQSDRDFTGSFPISGETGQMVLEVTKENGQLIYLWLEDGRGNRDYRKSKAFLLKYDATTPDITGIKLLQPTYLTHVYNQKKTGRITLRVYYREIFPRQMVFFHPLLQEVRQDVTHKYKGLDSLDVAISVLNAIDGDYWIKTVLYDSAGNISQPDSVLIKLDSTPPTITLAPFDSVAGENQSMEITAVITDKNPVVTARLQYWQGGKRFKLPQVDMSRLDDSTYSAIIPADVFGKRGVEFAIYAGDGLNLMRDPLSTATVTSRIIRVQIAGSNQSGLTQPNPLPAGSEVERYTMFSVPLQLDNPSPKNALEDDLGPFDKKRWRFFQWDNLKSTFNEYPNTGDILPGRVFWIITSLQNITLDTGPGLTMSTGKPFVIALKKGWNDIGNPFNFDVSWQDIFTASAADTQKIIGPYAFEEQWFLRHQVPVLKPWSGYSIYTESNDISLVIPPLEAVATVSKTDPTGPFNRSQWAFAVSAQVNNARDDHNFFGTAVDASAVWDYPYDWVEPYTMGKSVSLYFVRPENKLTAVKFASDFRAPQSGDIWKFEFQSDWLETEATLKFQQLKKPADNFSLTLVDLDARVSINVLQDSIYTFWLAKNQPVRHFQVYAGNQDFMQQYKDEIPNQASEFSLVQNYPNPFNSSTMISYELKEQTFVNLAIYNLLAQRVKLVYSGEQSAGFYQYIWDARDENNQEMGTGVYILRLETSKHTSTRKMIFMR